MDENGTSFLKMLNTHNLCVLSTFRMKTFRFSPFHSRAGWSSDLPGPEHVCAWPAGRRARVGGEL